MLSCLIIQFGSVVEVKLRCKAIYTPNNLKMQANCGVSLWFIGGIQSNNKQAHSMNLMLMRRQMLTSGSSLSWLESLL